MTRKTDKNIKSDSVKNDFSLNEEFGYSTTLELPRQGGFEDIPTRDRTCLEIIGLGEKNKVVELIHKDIVIGRSPDCDIQIPYRDVSRKHARILFQNDEFHIEDLGSRNRLYLNGIKVKKCTLRNNDQISIGGVKIVYYEETKLEKA